MQWYTSRFNSETDLNPPSYLIERISDLEYVSRLAQKSPSEARTVLANVIHKLNQHHDDDFVTMLSPAFKKMLDSPIQAKKVISRVIALMTVAREEKELKERRQWWKT
jgi:hypothetical protein